MRTEFLTNHLIRGRPEGNYNGSYEREIEHETV